MARIRTIKPEFWSHPVMGRLDDASKIMALALLNFADDEGYFLADPILIRNFARPFDEDSSSTRRALETLSRVGWIEVVDHPTHGPIGQIVNFEKHQRIDRPTPSKIRDYFDSSIIRRGLDEGSPLEGNREQGKEQGTTTTASTNDTPPASPPSASGAAAEVVGKPKRKAKPQGKDFAIAALELSPGVEAAFNRVWARYPRQGWNFTTKRPAPRRINYAEAVKRFSEILQFCPVRTSEGDAITADDLADATLAWVNTRVKEARAENSEIPNVPCVANFFSSAEGSKHHWKEALLEFFQAIPEAACH